MSDMPLYIIGAGGHAAVVAEIALDCGMTIAGFIDDNPARHGAMMLDWTVLGGRERIPAGAAVTLAIGHNAVRAKLLAEAEAQGWALPMLVHPTATISRFSTLGAGTVVMPHVVVNARTQIGRGCILNTACSVDHDCVIGDCTHIAPGARLAGTVTVGGGTLIGIGSCVHPNLHIGAGAVIGAGAAVVHAIPDGTVASGVPARVHLRAGQ